VGITVLGSERAAPSSVSNEWLLRRYRDANDHQAREELVRRMHPLARHVAGQYRGGRDQEDVHAAALMGLTKAIERFDVDFGTSLVSYAYALMTGEVLRHLRDHSWAVRVPRPLRERAGSVSACVERLTATEGRSPTPGRVAAELALTLEQVLEALQVARARDAQSLDAAASTSDASQQTIGDSIGFEDVRLERAEQRADLGRLRHLLNDLDRQILFLSFVRDLPQSEIGDRLGISQMQVSRRLRAAVARLAAAASEDVEFPAAA
jgi:RNA polymerase sigma-B factor